MIAWNQGREKWKTMFGSSYLYNCWLVYGNTFMNGSISPGPNVNGLYNFPPGHFFLETGSYYVVQADLKLLD
jgi:hypothetical protein